MKKRSFWKEQGDKYKYDYIPALLAHSFSWTFCVMLPIAVVSYPLTTMFYIMFVLNTAIHALIDHNKANTGKLNLVQDQTLHIVQIAITFIVSIL